VAQNSPDRRHRPADAVKRLFDLAAAGAGLVVLSPVLLAAAVLVKLDSRGPVLFTQWRVGRELRPFLIYKLRTMRAAQAGGPELTRHGDSRITRVGKLLRRTKLDELPQLFNVLKGDMSLVGPRPEVPRYVQLFHDDYREILQVRPGITDLASIRFRNESELLAGTSDPEGLYVTQILPEKIALAKEYQRHWSLRSDIRLIVRTIFGAGAEKAAQAAGRDDG
jgi:lipopolysaccharide/colanic/teichoic acid biosynthesis glycosyltransferase